MTIHVIGAGLSGLSAALEAADAGFEVVLHEAAAHAGGRCRSWHDEKLGAVIDNGTHMVVAANRSVFRYLDRIGSRAEMRPCSRPLPMVDLADGREWVASPAAYTATVLASIPRMLFGSSPAIAPRLERSRHYRDFWEPMAVSVMNTPAEAASAKVFRTVLSRTLWRGASACRPFIALNGLSRAFVDPALAALSQAGVAVRLRHALRSVELENRAIRELRFDDEILRLSRNDRVVMALPYSVARRTLPDLPDLPASPILNAHFRLAVQPGKHLPDGILGVVGGDAHWLSLRGDILSVTVSAAAYLAERSFDEVSERLWHDCTSALKIKGKPLSARIVVEKRATIFHSPEVETRRPAAKAGDNFVLAGDWTATGLPCTLEGAILSGRMAIEALR